MNFLENGGMTTIEACVLVPASLMLAVFLVWVGFYKYDLNVLSQAASIAVQSGSRECGLSNEEIVALVEERMDELLKDKLIGMEGVNYDVTVTAAKVTVQVSAGFEVPGGIFLSDLYETGSWDMELEKSAPRINPSMLLRAAEIMNETFERETAAKEADKD